MRFNFLFTLTIILISACDNSTIEPKFETYLAPEDIIDSAYLKLNVKYATTLEERTFIVRSRQTIYNLNTYTYTHTITFTDGSIMIIKAADKFRAMDQFYVREGFDVASWQSFQAVMSFTDQYKNETYEFRAKINGLSVSASNNNNFILLNFNDIYCGTPGGITVKCSLNGTLALKNY